MMGALARQAGRYLALADATASPSLRAFWLGEAERVRGYARAVA